MSHVTIEKMVNYGNVVDLLSEKRHEWNIELFFYLGIVEMAKERDDRIAINPWLILFVYWVINLWLPAGKQLHC